MASFSVKTIQSYEKIFLKTKEKINYERLDL